MDQCVRLSVGQGTQWLSVRTTLQYGHLVLGLVAVLVMVIIINS